jgi:hypothetical protein
VSFAAAAERDPASAWFCRAAIYPKTAGALP